MRMQRYSYVVIMIPRADRVVDALEDFFLWDELQVKIPRCHRRRAYGRKRSIGRTKLIFF